MANIGLKPFEYTIYCFLKNGSGDGYTIAEIATSTYMDRKTASSWTGALVKKHLVKTRKSRGKKLYYI